MAVELQESVEFILRKANGEVLGQVADHIKVDEDRYLGKENRIVLRGIFEVFDRTEDPAQKEAMLKGVKELLPDTLKSLLDKDLDVKDEVPDMTEKRRSVLETVHVLESLGISSSSSGRHRKEFKIQGIVGGQKDSRLDYLSLCAQIAEAKEKGYSDNDIVFAIRRAVSTTSEVRKYLDSIPHLSMGEIMKCVRSSYQEKSATEWFQELNKLCQGPSESSSSFLFRALGSRQRVILASEIENGIKYEIELVQPIFLHAVRTGLRSTSIRAHMQPFLKANASDDVLIEELAKAASDENERISKQESKVLKDKRVSFQVNEVSSPQSQVSAANIDRLVEPLLETIEKMSKRLETLERRKQTDQTRGYPASPSWKRRSCAECQGKNVQCKHCWKCGKEGHFSRNCQKVQAGDTDSNHSPFVACSNSVNSNQLPG